MKYHKENEIVNFFRKQIVDDGNISFAVRNRTTGTLRGGIPAGLQFQMKRCYQRRRQRTIAPIDTRSREWLFPGGVAEADGCRQSLVSWLGHDPVDHRDHVIHWRVGIE